MSDKTQQESKTPIHDDMTRQASEATSAFTLLLVEAAQVAGAVYDEVLMRSSNQELAGRIAFEAFQRRLNFTP